MHPEVWGRILSKWVDSKHIAKSSASSLQADIYTSNGIITGLVDTVAAGLLAPPVSGLMGLAFQGISTSGGTPFWLRLVSSGAWDKPLMSFWLTRFLGVDGADSEEIGGVFTMGAVNETLFSGEIDYQPLSIPTGTYWILALSGKFFQMIPSSC